MLKNVVNHSLISILVIITSITYAQDKKTKLKFPKTDLAAENFIPKPLEVKSSNKSFVLNPSTCIFSTNNMLNSESLGTFLAEKIKAKTGLELTLRSEEASKNGRGIFIQYSTDLEGGAEAYQLKIKKSNIILSANTAEGAFRGIQTLLQIIPDSPFDRPSNTWVIATGTIKDAPQFEYRSAMLDVARHFFAVEDVKKYIDLLSYYKYNTLHLHLSDDQGWRIEIKSWPKLTEIGGSTQVGGGPGGFYSQEDFSEIVAYAAAHYMTIVPEIEMPGHSNAASVSYPFLNGNGEALELYTGTKVGFSTLDARKDSVYEFIDDVIREITALSPAPYFHIGADEIHATKPEDYVYFVNRVEKIVHKYGKRMIGFEEISNADIDESTIVQYWNKKEIAQIAAGKNNQIIISPSKKAYVDMMYNLDSKYGLNWAAYISTKTAYIWNPELYGGIPIENILGVEALLWSETIAKMDELEYLAFPRVIGIAELGWTPQENRNWEDYRRRLAHQAAFLHRMNVNYYPSPLVDWVKVDEEVKKTKPE